ncbi:CDP-diacylglycerol/serineO-phosphatidyltransfera se [Candidatus Zixiibacteriota bacterium]|nr:CDP-diacylglycerol/serineO-phosphatidyltransfera se [candidate division Zixibacteria bacterium]
MEVSNFRGLFPGTFTMGNVVCGFLALLSAFEGEITTACWLIILAAFLDGLDGKVARLSGTSSRFGVELDSLADFLSFGVAPAIIMYIVKLHSMGKWGWIISIVYIMASAYRLARFNLLAQTDEKKEFMGLPVPGAALTLVAYVIFCNQIWGQLEYSEYLVSMVILFSFLMVSQIEYDAMPDRFNTRRNRVKLMLVFIAALLVLWKPRLLLFPIFASYIIIGLIREGYRFFYLGVGYVRKRQTGNRDELEKIEDE